jgi:hypothetical protein
VAIDREGNGFIFTRKYEYLSVTVNIRITYLLTRGIDDSVTRVADTTSMSGEGERPEPVHLYEFNPVGAGKDGEWSVIKFHPNSTNEIHSIRLVTWNIWFDRLHQELRFKFILHELKSLPAVDVIVLQEATESFLSILREDEGFQSAWLITNCWDAGHERALRSDIWYRNMILVRKDWARCTTASAIRLPSSMSRFMVTLEILTSNGMVITHLPILTEIRCGLGMSTSIHPAKKLKCGGNREKQQQHSSRKKLTTILRRYPSSAAT